MPLDLKDYKALKAGGKLKFVRKSHDIVEMEVPKFNQYSGASEESVKETISISQLEAQADELSDGLDNLQEFIGTLKDVKKAKATPTLVDKTALN